MALMVSPVVHRASKEVTGRSSDVLLPIWAAKKTVKKSVFCVDNVDLNFNEDDIRAFVVSLGVEVFTCLLTQGDVLVRQLKMCQTERLSDCVLMLTLVNVCLRQKLGQIPYVSLIVFFGTTTITNLKIVGTSVWWTF